MKSFDPADADDYPLVIASDDAEKETLAWLVENTGRDSRYTLFEATLVDASDAAGISHIAVEIDGNRIGTLAPEIASQIRQLVSPDQFELIDCEALVEDCSSFEEDYQAFLSQLRLDLSQPPGEARDQIRKIRPLQAASIDRKPPRWMLATIVCALLFLVALGVTSMWYEPPMAQDAAPYSQSADLQTVQPSRADSSVGTNPDCCSPSREQPSGLPERQPSSPLLERTAATVPSNEPRKSSLPELPPIAESNSVQSGRIAKASQQPVQTVTREEPPSEAPVTQAPEHSQRTADRPPSDNMPATEQSSVQVRLPIARPKIRPAAAPEKKPAVRRYANGRKRLKTRHAEPREDVSSAGSEADRSDYDESAFVPFFPMQGGYRRAYSQYGDGQGSYQAQPIVIPPGRF